MTVVVEEILVKIGVDANEINRSRDNVNTFFVNLENAADDADEKVKTLSNRLSDLSRTLARGFGRAARNAFRGIAIGATAATAAVAGTVASFASFEEAFASVVTLLNDESFSDLDFDEGVANLREELQQLSAESGESIDVLTTSLFNLISATGDAENSIETLRTATLLAAAGSTTTEAALNGITNAINAYNLSAEDALTISKVFFEAQRQGVTNVEQLADRLALASSTASILGVSLEETLAAGAAITRGGLSTSQAFQGLGQIFQNVINPIDRAADEAQRLGIEFGSAALREQGLEQFVSSIVDNPNFNEQTIENLFTGAESLRAAAALFGSQRTSFQEILTNVRDEETLNESFARGLDRTLNTTSRNFRRAQQEVALAVRSLGEVFAPLANTVIGVFAEAIQSLTQVIEDNEERIVSFVDRIADSISALFVLITEGAGSDAFRQFDASAQQNALNILNVLQQIAQTLSQIASILAATAEGASTAANIAGGFGAGLGEIAGEIAIGLNLVEDEDIARRAVEQLRQRRFQGREALEGIFRANGGSVFGSGNGRSDSINARLSNGEFVVNSLAASKNRSLLERINSFGGARNFADGGPVLGRLFINDFPIPTTSNAASGAARNLTRIQRVSTTRPIRGRG